MDSEQKKFSEKEIRDIIHDELSFFFKNEKYTVNRPMEIGRGGKIQFSGGLVIGSIETSDTTIGFYGETPVVQGLTISDPSGGLVVDGEARTAINTIIDRLQAIGIIA